MKPNIHPKYNTDTKVVCACGNKFTTGSTMAEIHTEICSNCHPFYTGKQNLIDTAGRVERFQKLVTKATDKKATIAARQASRIKVKAVKVEADNK